jgi:hypothetical protein
MFNWLKNDGWFKLSIIGIALLAVTAARSTYLAPQPGTAQNVYAWDSTHSGTSTCAAATTQCPVVGLVDSAGVEKGTSTNPVVTANGASDPCQTQSHSFALVNVSASGLDSTPIVAGTSAKKTYVCQIVLQNNAADNVAVFEASGGACAAGQLGMWGGTTAATGFNFSANGGIALGNGAATIANTTTNQNDICVITSAATQLSGRVVYVVQ